MYLYSRFIRHCRCSFGDQRICNLLFFELADAFQPVYYIKLHLHLAFSWIEDTAYANFASTSHIFDNMRILLIEILHPQFALSITCRFRAEIVHPQFSKIHYRRYIRNARPVKFYYLIHQACDNVQAENKLDTFQ